MAPMKHDKHVSLAALQILTGGKPLAIVGYPDEVERTQKAVDLIAVGDGRRFVVEHTAIETYEQQKRDDALFREVFAPIRKELNGKLPGPGHYILVAPSATLHRVKKPSLVRRHIRAFVERVAPTLTTGGRGLFLDEIGHIHRERPNGVPFELELQKWDGLVDGGLLIARFPPEEVEELRRSRIVRALDEKCPKLAAARRDEGPGALSVLVLEFNDIAMANGVVVCDAVVAVAAGRELPDRIMVVNTSIADEWIVWAVEFGSGARYGHSAIDPSSVLQPASALGSLP